VSLSSSDVAAVRKTTASRFFTFFLPGPTTFPLLMSLLGTNPVRSEYLNVHRQCCNFQEGDWDKDW
jgi:hypothetical protein